MKQFIRKRRDDAFVLKPKHAGALASNRVKQPLSEISMLRRKSTESKHLWLPVFALFVTTCAVVINVIQGMFGYPFHETIMLEGQKFVSIQGFAYAAPLPAEYSPSGAQSTSARLYENGRAFASYTQHPTLVENCGRGIFSFPEKGRLLFSASDNSDPRMNGRAYRIDVPRRFSVWVSPICFTAWLVAGTVYFSALPDRREALLLWHRRIASIRERSLRLSGNGQELFSPFPRSTSYFLTHLYGRMSIVQLTLPASVDNIEHYPPVY